MKLNKLIAFALISALFLNSCTSDDDTVANYVPKGDYDSGVLVLNEGNFGQDNASLTYISFDLSESENIDYLTLNPGGLIGNTGQSIGFHDNLAYIVVNVSGKIEVVNRYSLKKVGSITGFNQPRYIAFANGKGYVTNWNSGAGTGTVSVINLATNTVTSTISVSDFPNKIIENAGKLYVAHNDLGTTGNKITVIDAATNAVTTTIAVSDMPDTLAVDGNTLWVSCNGHSQYAVAPEVETSGSIVKVNLASNTVTQTFPLPNATDHVSYFSVFVDNAYYVSNSKVYKMPLTATALPTAEAFTPTVVDIYGFAVKNNRIYIADDKLFTSNGEVKVYSTGTFGPDPIGTLLASFETGVGPNGFYFNQ